MDQSLLCKSLDELKEEGHGTLSRPHLSVLHQVNLSQPATAGRRR